MNFVAVDLGASSTRFTDDSGRVSFLPNNMVMFDDLNKEIRIEPNDDELQNNLEVIIEKDGESTYFPVKVIVGNLAERYSPTQIQPSTMSNKHNQRINYISAVMSVAVSKLINGLTDDITLFIALPPVEVKTAEDLVRKNLVGKYRVTFPKYLGGRVISFNIVDVECKEESVMAAVSYFFTMQGTVREEHKDYLRGNVLSLDIGASTTDLAIIRNGQYLDKSGKTYKTGGNVARDFITDRVREMYGYDLPTEDADLAMAEGRLQQGNTYIEIRDIVNDAKKTLASSIITQMDTYFRLINMPISTIRAIIVSGGGSLSSQYINKDTLETVVTSKPMSEYITEELQTLCNGIEVEKYGENSRVANISGLFITAKMRMFKKAQMQQQQL